MKQVSLGVSGFELSIKLTRKREFLDEMNLVGPWAELVGLIQPHAPAGKTGRPPFADAGYQGAMKRNEATGVPWQVQVALRPGKGRALDKSNPIEALTDKIEKLRAKVEHPFRVIKHQFGYVKVRYRGLIKNTAQFKTLFALSHLWMARKRLIEGMQA
jgi:IS5 family transposase